MSAATTTAPQDRGAAAARARKLRRRAAPHKRLIDDVLPPEGVPLRFEVADIAARFGAQTVDILLSGGFALCLTLLIGLSDIAPTDALIALASLLFFFIRAPYYVLTELLWNGQTLGKRMLGLRVLSGTGSGLTPYQIVARNLMKEFEVFAPGTYLLVVGSSNIVEGLIVTAWIIGLILVPLFNKRRQRLGDLIANTYVIHQPQARLLPDLAAEAEPAAGGFRFQTRHLEHYGAYELQVLEKVLQAEPPATAPAADQESWLKNLSAIAEKVRRKTEYEDRVAPGDEAPFLRAFYTAQRAHLESRRLFGDARADKFYKHDQGAGEDGAHGA